MFRDWFAVHTPLVLRWVISYGWAGCACLPGQCRFLPPLQGEDLLGVVIGPTTEWAKWGLIFQGLHCVRTFYQFSSDPLNELEGESDVVGCVAGLVSLPWYDERDLVRLVKFVLDHGVDVNARQPDGQTALFSAVNHSALAVVRELLIRGADPNALDRKGNSVLVGLGGLPHSDFSQDKACLRMLVRMNLSTAALFACANSYTSIDFEDVHRAAERKMFVAVLILRVTRARAAYAYLCTSWPRSSLSVLPAKSVRAVLDRVWHSQTSSEWDY
jgi:hypothetical protein